MKPSEVIREARPILFERGWTQRMEMGPDGSVCLVGAIKAARWEHDNSNGVHFTERRVPPKVRAFLKAALNVNSIEHWNDMRERTFDDVIDALDKAEKLAEISEAQ